MTAIAWLRRELERLCDALAEATDRGYGDELLPGWKPGRKEKKRSV